MPTRQLCWLSWWAGLVLLLVLVQRADSVTEEQASVLAQVQAKPCKSCNSMKSG
jgi:hypothetical protein